MTKANVLTIALLGLFICSSGMTSAKAQANPKRDKCLAEARAKGLIVNPSVSGGRGGGQGRGIANLGPQRQAFMAECMNRK
jgi:hypothetical protein